MRKTIFCFLIFLLGAALGAGGVLFAFFLKALSENFMRAEAEISMEQARDYCRLPLPAECRDLSVFYSAAGPDYQVYFRLQATPQERLDLLEQWKRIQGEGVTERPDTPVHRKSKEPVRWWNPPGVLQEESCLFLWTGYDEKSQTLYVYTFTV